MSEKKANVYYLLALLAAASCGMPVTKQDAALSHDAEGLVDFCREDESNRKLLLKGCVECFDGWGSKSVRVDFSQPGCAPHLAASNCPGQGAAVSRGVSTCEPCGIDYLAGKELEGKVLAEPVSCDVYFKLKTAIENDCGGCVRYGSAN